MAEIEGVLKEDHIDQTAAVDQTGEQQKQIDPAVEDRAKLQGWVPKEEFRGDPERHITAEEFVKRADHMMPILKTTNQKIEAKNEALAKELSETRGTLDKVISIQEKYSADLHDSKLADLREQKRQAVEKQDIELYDRLEKQEQDIPKPVPLEVKKEEPQIPPEMARWFDDNKWFNADKFLNEEARELGDMMAKRGHHLAAPGNEYEFGEEIKRKLTTLYPEKFKNPKQQTSDMDETNLRDSDNLQTGKKGWNDLPGPAQQHCTRLMAEIPGYTKERYLNDYFEG